MNGFKNNARAASNLLPRMISFCLVKMVEVNQW